MVQIIGTDPKHVHRATCRKCASILEYTKSEEQSYTKTDYGGGTDRYYFIVCPKCAENVITHST